MVWQSVGVVPRIERFNGGIQVSKEHFGVYLCLVCGFEMVLQTKF